MSFSALTFRFAVLAVTMSCFCGDALADDDDRQRLLGVWDYVSVTYEGKPFDVGQQAAITITADHWTIRRNGLVIRTTWSIDESKNPKHLNVVVEREDTTFEMKSIYQLAGDRLVVCERDDPTKPRPAMFRAQPGDGQFLIVLQRRAAE